MALVVSFGARAAALAALAGTGAIWALIAVHALGRTAPPVVAAWLPPARRDGLGLSAAAPAAETVMTAVLIGVAVILIALPVWTAIVAAVCAAIAVAVMALLARRQIGGQTGDVLGALVQVAEAVALLVIAARA
jgi:adenosylcobinamide-GDP ribazoletransferase